MRKAMARLVLALAMVGVVQACGGICGLNQARGCGIVRVPDQVRVVDTSGSHMCFIDESVLAATLTDVRRLPDSYIILVEMPGVSSGNVKVEAADGILSVSGLSEDDPMQAAWARRDRGAFTKLFSRKFLLPDHVDVERMGHHLDSGLLHITLPINPGSELKVEVEVEQDSVQAGRELKAFRSIRAPGIGCTIQNAEAYIRPQPLLDSNRPSCDPDQVGGVVVVSPFTDLLDRGDEYELIMEMPGARSAEVNVVCGEEDSRGGCIVFVSGTAQDEQDVDEGVVVRMERGGASKKVFVSRYYFRPGEITSANTSHFFTDGLLKVKLQIPRNLREL